MERADQSSAAHPVSPRPVVIDTDRSPRGNQILSRYPPAVTNGLAAQTWPPNPIGVSLDNVHEGE